MVTRVLLSYKLYELIFWSNSIPKCFMGLFNFAKTLCSIIVSILNHHTNKTETENRLNIFNLRVIHADSHQDVCVTFVLLPVQRDVCE